MAVGTELLLGQIADTNSAWLGEHLAANGVASHFHQAVGDNHDRITLALRTALARSDGVIMCGGLGPTQDDITREAIADVMNVPLVRDQAIVDVIAGFFETRGRTMTDNNARQADVPQGATIIPQVAGTAPGLICPVGNKVVYAVPGVPYEMAEMFERGILPDLRARMAESGEESGVIASRVLRTWGASESGLAESLQDRIDALDATGDVTLAFLASGIEGIKVRITARARTLPDVVALLDKEDAQVRLAIEERLGDIVFGVDDESMEVAVATRLIARGWTFGVAESLTGGLIASRLVNVAGASSWFRGGVVAYASQVKFDVLGVPAGPVVTESAAAAMADGAARVTGADVGLGITGVAGPDDQEGVAPGTVFVGLHLPGQPAQTRQLRVPGDRERVRQYGAISALDLLRRALDASPGLSTPRSQGAHRAVTLEREAVARSCAPGRYGQVKTDNGPRVLVVDDEPSIVDAVATSLRYEGFTVDEAMTGRKALAQAQEDPPDLVILDVMLPDLDGLEVTRRLRSDGLRVPVLFLTARDTLQDKLAGLTVGGDDYVTKPFALAEVIARVHAILRRTGYEPEDDGVLRFSDLELDESAHEVRRDGNAINLTATEFNLLRYFMLNPRHVLSKSQILDHVWHYDFGGDGNVVETYVSYLRKKLEKFGPPLIHTIRLVGYTLREPESANGAA